jgi:hypothetical protein
MPSRPVKHAARAFDDAVRDILGADGAFTLADAREPGLVWRFDGRGWTPLVLRARRGSAQPRRRSSISRILAMASLMRASIAASSVAGVMELGSIRASKMRRAIKNERCAPAIPSRKSLSSL